MRFRSAVLLLLVVAIVSCGGGETGPLPPVELDFDLGLVRSDRASTHTVQVPNPLGSEASAELEGEVDGPFAVASSLPADVASGAELALSLSVDPVGGGALQGGLTLVFTPVGDGHPRKVVITTAAEVEQPAVTSDPAMLDFGNVPVRESKTLDLVIVNQSFLTPVRLTGASALPSGFSLQGGGFPLDLIPGQVALLQLTYEPQSATGSAGFDLVVSNDVEAPDLRVPISAATDGWVREWIEEFGSVPVTDGETAWLELDVPPDAVSVSLEAVGPESTMIGLLGLEGPGGRIYENDQATGEFLWTTGDEGVFCATVPNNDREEVQLVSGGGTYRFRFYMMSLSTTALDVRAIVHSRPGGVIEDGVLDLNIFLAPAIGVSAVDAPTEERLSDLLAEADRIFSQQGLRLGEVAYFDLDDTTYDDVTYTEFPELLRESDAAPRTRLNLFLVRTAVGGGVLGVAARVPGPARNGTGVSGVMVDYDYGSGLTAGHVAAHELCHYLGLYHTVEQSGSHDMIDDTAECPADGASAVCPTIGNDYLMHWFVVSGDPVITDGQGRVILGHPLVQPPVVAPALAAWAPPRMVAGALDDLPPGWCGTPGCEHARK